MMTPTTALGLRGRFVLLTLGICLLVGGGGGVLVSHTISNIRMEMGMSVFFIFKNPPERNDQINKPDHYKAMLPDDLGLVHVNVEVHHSDEASTGERSAHDTT